MWKFLKYWTGLQLVVNMPFILPLASAMQTLFQRKDHQPPAKVQEAQKPPRVLVTYTGPDTATVDWKRVYKRITGRKTDVTVQKMGRQEYALAPQQPLDRTIRVPAPASPSYSRRRGDWLASVA